jgi:hypothetical protein
MSSTPPFVDPATGSLNTAQVLSEALPIGRLVGLFVAISLVPFALVFAVFGGSAVGAILTVVAGFVLAVGAGVVLVYVVARGTQLAGE